MEIPYKKDINKIIREIKRERDINNNNKGKLYIKVLYTKFRRDM